MLELYAGSLGLAPSDLASFLQCDVYVVFLSCVRQENLFLPKNIFENDKKYSDLLFYGDVKF